MKSTKTIYIPSTKQDEKRSETSREFATAKVLTSCVTVSLMRINLYSSSLHPLTHPTTLPYGMYVIHAHQNHKIYLRILREYSNKQVVCFILPGTLHAQKIYVIRSSSELQKLCLFKLLFWDISKRLQLHDRIGSDKTIVNIAFDWLSHYLSTNHVRGVFFAEFSRVN